MNDHELKELRVSENNYLLSIVIMFRYRFYATTCLFIGQISNVNVNWKLLHTHTRAANKVFSHIIRLFRLHFNELKKI